MMVTLPPDYRPTDDEEFMNPIQVEYFRQKLLRWRGDLLKEANGTLASLSEGGIHESDITDRASVETDRALELRTRDRARKLISKIDQALMRIENRHLRLLRGDRRADRAAPAGGPRDRHPVDRGAGAPRTHGARPPRRLSAALNTVSQRDGIEVDRRSNRAAAQAEVSQKLGLVQRQRALDRLELQDMAEPLFGDRFKQARAEVAMDTHGQPDDRVGQFAAMREAGFLPDRLQLGVDPVMNNTDYTE